MFQLFINHRTSDANSLPHGPRESTRASTVAEIAGRRLHHPTAKSQSTQRGEPTVFTLHNSLYTIPSSLFPLHS